MAGVLRCYLVGVINCELYHIQYITLINCNELVQMIIYAKQSHTDPQMVGHLMVGHFLRLGNRVIHCKKRLAIFPSPAGMSITKLSLAGNNYILFPG
jgi:hypothetical protein